MKNLKKGLVILLAGMGLLTGCGASTNTGTNTRDNGEATSVDWPFYAIELDGETVGYMLGSIHFGKKSMYPFPDEIITSVEESSALYSEVTFSSIMSPSSAVLMRQATKAEPHVLSNLSSEEKSDLEANLESYDISLDDLEETNYYGLMSLMQGEYMSTSDVLNGVDLKLYSVAKDADIPNKAFETIEGQVEIIQSATNPMILEDNSWIDEIPVVSVAKEDNERLLDYYIRGELEENFEDLFLESELEGSADIIIHQRNLDWVEQLKEILPDEEQTFIVVGAGHLYGETGLISQLEMLDYKVTKVET